MNLGPEASVHQAPGGLALGPAVFSPQLLPVPPELLVEARIGQDVALRLGFLVSGQKILVVEDPNLPIFHLQHDFLTDDPVGNNIAVGVEGDLAVPVDLAENLQRRVVVGSRPRPQAGELLFPENVDRLVMSSMDSAVGRLVQPGQDVLVGFFNRFEAVSPPEPFPQVIDRPLHFSLRPGAVGGAEPRLEAVMMGKMEELDVEHGFSGRVLPDDDVFHVVVEDLGRDTAQVLECPDMSVLEAFHRPSPDELGIIGPAEPQDEFEAEDHLGSLDLKIAPIALGLLPGFGFKPGVSQPVFPCFFSPDEAFNHVIASRISPVFQPVPYPGRLIIVFLKIIFDRLNEGRQNRVQALDLPVAGEVLTFQMFPDCFPMQPQLLGDRPDAFPVPVHRLDVHEYLLGDHRVSPPLLEETIPPFQSPGGTLFIPMTGTFLHAHRQPAADEASDSTFPLKTSRLNDLRWAIVFMSSSLGREDWDGFLPLAPPWLQAGSGPGRIPGCSARRGRSEARKTAPGGKHPQAAPSRTGFPAASTPRRLDNPARDERPAPSTLRPSPRPTARRFPPNGGTVPASSPELPGVPPACAQEASSDAPAC